MEPLSRYRTPSNASGSPYGKTWPKRVSLPLASALPRACLGVVLELFIEEEDLLAGSKDKLPSAVGAGQYTIHKFHGNNSQNREATGPGKHCGEGLRMLSRDQRASEWCGAASFRYKKRRPPVLLVLLFSNFLAITLARERFFHALLLAWLQIKGVALNLLDDVFGLNLAFKTPKSILKGLAFLNSYLCQRENTSKQLQRGTFIMIRPRRKDSEAEVAVP